MDDDTNGVLLRQSDDEEFGDMESRRFSESYSLSADVSESESSASTAATFPSYHRVTPPLLKFPTQKTQHQDLSESELMKERFAKLLLGEDMTGSGKGVTTGLAISNAITKLAGTVFGEVWKLEPLTLEKRSMWEREMNWLLCVTDSIIELVPSVQDLPGGGSRFEIMVPQQRSDLFVNLPALKKLDGMLMSILDSFNDTEFFYIDRGIVAADGEILGDYSCSASSRRRSLTMEGKCWLPFPKVPAAGLSRGTRKKLQQCKECSHQIFKAAVAINTSVLSQMGVPQVYVDSLPKSEKACLGETFHRFITADHFSPDCLQDYLDLSSEFSTMDTANRMESAMHIWMMKYQKKKPSNTKTGLFWGSTKSLVGDTEKSKLFAHRAETLLKNLKLRFPGLLQTDLDTIKIQYNKDVGQAILESYSRVLMNLAVKLMARINDLLYVDEATKRRAITRDAFIPCMRRGTSPGPYFHRTSFSSAVVCANPFPCSIASSHLRRSASQPSSRHSLDSELKNLTLRESTNGRFRFS